MIFYYIQQRINLTGADAADHIYRDQTLFKKVPG